MPIHPLRKLTSMLTAAALLPIFPIFTANAEPTEKLTDSGLNYTEYVGTIQNPGAGYTTTVWANCAPNKTTVYSPTGSLALFFVDIGAFSGGTNGETDEDGNYKDGKDYDLDETFFTSWKQTLENCRKNGCMVGLRFRYDALGNANPEPLSFEQVLKHIQQIKERGLLEEYEDIIALVESGFVGKWGEQHGGRYTSVEYKARLLDTLLDAVPESIPVTVRTPDTFAEWCGIKRSQLCDEELYKKAEESGDENERRILSKRVGMYNDGYMGSDSDLGTYSNRELETDWLSSVSEETYYGGEFSGSHDFARQFETYLPQNAIPEMYKTHLSYINSNIFPFYKEYTFSSEYDVPDVDNSAYYGQDVFQFIRDHLGYRFVLRKSELTAETEQGGELKLKFSVENTGFANPIPHTQGYIILECDGEYIKAPIELDCHKWRSCTVTDSELTIKLPDSIKSGNWKVYLKETMGNCLDEVEGMPLRSIRFANEDTWNYSLGANLLGAVEISESSSHGTDNFMYEITENGTGEKTDSYWKSNSRTVVDGQLSFSGEWKDEMITAEDESGYTMSVKADEKYLYVMAKMPDSASAPVYNIQMNNPQKEDEYFWMYYASNGYVYFNHEDRNGCECKWNGNTVEFRLPFEIFGLKPQDMIKNLRVVLQDSANEWKSMCDLRVKEIKVPSDITVYTGKKDIRLKTGDSCELTVRTMLEDTEYQWLKDGKEIENAQGESYTIENADTESIGIYSVKLKIKDGAEKTSEIAELLEVFGSDSKVTYGDANCDDEVNMADAVLIMQTLANPDKYGINGTDPTHITKQGMTNGDVTGNVNGITNADALAIQKYCLKLLTELPEL